MDTPRSLMAAALLCALVWCDTGAAAPMPLDSYRFQAIYDSYTPTGSRVRRVAEFTPQGPIEGTIWGPPVGTRGAPTLSDIAFDPAGGTYYAGVSGREPGRFDPTTGTLTALPATDPELSNHPTGLTFDTTRNRLVLSTLGSEGFLFAYSPQQDRWTRLASLNNDDIFSVAYSAHDDAFYGLTATSLLRYDAAGRLTRRIPFDPQIPPFDLWQSQLAAAADRLVLLTQPMADPQDVSRAPAQHSYLIDPNTGSVTPLGPVRLVPEPATALWLFGTVAALLRRRPAGTAAA